MAGVSLPLLGKQSIHHPPHAPEALCTGVEGSLTGGQGLRIALTSTQGHRLLETRAWHATMILMLMFVLFVPDVLSLAGASNAADPAINALLLLCMATFLAEFGANIACRASYTVLEARTSCPRALCGK